MINLLSPSEKKKILREYYVRLGVLVALGVLLTEIVTFAMLLPSYAAITTEVDALTTELNERKSAVLPGDEEAQQELNMIKEKVALLKPSSAPLDRAPSVVLMEMLREKPRGLDISSFTYGRSNADVLIQVGGMARTREDLLAFQRSLLREDSIFTDVRYSENFLTKKEDINFQLTIKLKP